MPDENRREIKSFVLRQGRLTKGQEQALATWWPHYGIDTAASVLDFHTIFGNANPITVEIGFGNGESLAAMTLAQPEQNFIGIEVHTPGVGHLLQRIAALKLANIRILNTDAVTILKQRIAPASLARVQLFFPDPWHKTRHHKRRIVQTEFLDLLALLVKKDGIVHLATDWADYAEHMATVLQNHADFQTVSADGSPFSPRPATRPLTKFEQRGLRLGHGVWDLLYQRC